MSSVKYAQKPPSQSATKYNVGYEVVIRKKDMDIQKFGKI